jgi:hypothetical protein
MFKRIPQIHAGNDNYFKKFPQRPPLDLTRKKSGRLGSGNFHTYLYWILGGMAAIALIYFIGTFLKTAGVSAKLVFQEGEVFVKKYSSENWEKVATDAQLKKFDEIKTVEGARAIISFENGDIVRMDEYSRIILSEEKGGTLIVQTDGTTYHRIVKSEDKKYQVELTGIEGATKKRIESLGTAFWVKKIGTEISMGILEGKIKYLDEGKDFSLEAEEGQKIIIEENQGENKKEIDADDLRENFIAWNIEQDKKKEMILGASINLKLAEFSSSESQAQEENSNAEEEKDDNLDERIDLNGEATKEGVSLKWELKNVEAPEGLKILKSAQLNPEYPGSYYRSIRSDTTNSYVWDTTDGETYHFRVCIYDGSSGCQLYSNDLEVETIKVKSTEEEENCKDSGGTWDSEEEKCDCPSSKELKDGKCVTKTSETAKENCTDSGGIWDAAKDKCDCPEGEVLEGEKCVKEEFADSISLKGSSKKKGEASLSWSISGGDASQGYKIVASKSKNPTYPDDSSKSISKESTKSYTWEDLDKGKTYYFRVCVWNGEKCVAYSNNEEVKIDD